MSLRYIINTSSRIRKTIKISLLSLFSSNSEKKKETKESFEAWRKNRRARVRVFHSRLRVTSSRGEGEAFKLGPGWTDFLEWLFLSLENTSARKRGSGRGRKTIKIVVNVVAAGVRGGPLGIWILFRSKPFYIRDSLSLLFSNSQFKEGGKGRKKMVNGSMVKIGRRRGVATNGIFWEYIPKSETLFKSHRGGYFSLGKQFSSETNLGCDKLSGH